MWYNAYCWTALWGTWFHCVYRRSKILHFYLKLAVARKVNILGNEMEIKQKVLLVEKNNCKNKIKNVIHHLQKYFLFDLHAYIKKI